MKILKPILSLSVACLLAGIAGAVTTSDVESLVNSVVNELGYGHSMSWGKNNEIVYNYNGGKGNVTKEAYNPQSLPKNLQVPTKKGYKFSGYRLETRKCVTEKDKAEIAGLILSLGASGAFSDGKRAVEYKGISSNTKKLVKDSKSLKWSKTGRADRQTSKCKNYPSFEDGNNGLFIAVAQWDYIPYKVTLKTNGGNINNYSKLGLTKIDGGYTKDYTINQATFNLPTPTKENYKLIGWCTDKALTSCETNPELYDNVANKTYYAKWRSTIEYTVTLEVNGGGLGNKSAADGNWKQSGTKYTKKYTVDDTFTLPNAFKAGFAFSGWCTDKALKNCQQTVKLDKTTGNKTYYASYESMKMIGAGVQSGFIGTKVNILNGN